MNTLMSWFVKWIADPARGVKRAVLALTYYGEGRYCFVCGKSSSHFKHFKLRKNAECAHCGALERHRLLCFFLKNKTNLFDNNSNKVLHIAPEKCIEVLFKKRLGRYYLTADLLNPRAMVKMDVCNIQYPDDSFDVIYCSHVLEHVADDRQAMKELYRVLGRDGWAIINVPITRAQTFEDASIVSPEGRLKAFGQEDHVRSYGIDYVDRLREAGFSVDVITVDSLMGGGDKVKAGLLNNCGEIYFCTK